MWNIFSYSIDDGGDDGVDYGDDHDDDETDDDDSDDNAVVTRSAPVCPLDPASKLPGSQQHCISALWICVLCFCVYICTLCTSSMYPVYSSTVL